MGSSGAVEGETTVADVTRTTGVGRPPEVARARGIGRYLTIEQLGRGGMGEVLRAYDPKLKREVALKLLPSELLSAAAQMALLHEAQAMAQLSHPNVVTVFDVELSDHDVVIAMEYVRGETLKTWLSQPRPWREVLARFVAAGRGLAAAHAAGMLHRDFKPANVLVGTDGRVRVADFGLASGMSNVTSDAAGEETIAGTPRYMAPEQHEGAACVPATDQYAFCIALWEALTGQAPFTSGGHSDFAKIKRRGPPPWPRTVAVPAHVREAIARGLAGDPRDRWPSMQALLESLARASVPRARRWIVLGSASTTALLVAAGGMLRAEHLSQRCTGAPKQIAEAWSTERQELAAAAFARSDMPYAADTWQKVAPQLDAYASTWADVHTRTCEATTVRHEQSYEDMDSSMACLQRAKNDLKAVADLLAKADAEVVQNAAQMIDGLPPLRRCEDTELLRAEVPPPPPREQAAVDAFNVELAELKALKHAGKYPEGFALAHRLAERSRDITYPPLQIEVLFELAWALETSEQHHEAENVYRRALRLALASGQLRVAHDTASRLIQSVGANQHRISEGLVYAEIAAGLHRFGDADTHSGVRGAIGSVLDQAGRYAEAEVERRAAVELAAQALGGDGPNPERQSLALTLIHLGRYDEAEQELRAEIAAQTAAYGPRHPFVAALRYYLAATLQSALRYQQSEEELRAVIALLEPFGPEHYDTAAARGTLATTLLALDRPAEAEVEVRAALPVLIKVVGPEHVTVASGRTVLGNALAALGRYAEAEAEQRASLAIAMRTLGPEHPRTGYARAMLSRTLGKQGRHREAEAEARNALAIFASSIEPDHPWSFGARHNLGVALAGQGRYEEGIRELQTAMELATRKFGSDSPPVENIRESLEEVVANGSKRRAVRGR